MKVIKWIGMTLGVILTLGLILISKDFRAKYFKSVVETKFDNILFAKGIEYVAEKTIDKKDIVINNSSFIISKFFGYMNDKFANILVVKKFLDDVKQEVQSEMANLPIKDAEEFIEKLSKRVIDWYNSKY